MKDMNDDTLLGQHLSGEPPRVAFRQQTLRDSTAAFIGAYRRRSVWRRARLASAAVLVAGVAFFGGRLSVPSELHPGLHVGTQVGAKSDGVNVPSELVVWLEAARFFRQLGMEERMARAVDRAGRLLPADTGIAEGEAGQVLAAARSIEGQEKLTELMGMSGPHLSADSLNQILAQSFGD